MTILIIIPVLLVILPLIFVLFCNYKYPEIHWNWKKINLEEMKFSKNFIWGTATASHQVEGGCNNNNWYNWEQNKDEFGNPRIKNNQKAGNACEHWTRYEDDVKLIKNLGVSHYRFSLEWSKIEPQRGVYDQEVISHYSKIIDSLIEEDITPVITLHHFTNPIWYDKMGGFENEENIPVFVEFCEKMFNYFSSRVETWCTINEPEVYSVMGYFAGVFPPGRRNPKITVEVLKNLLIAHTAVYSKLKSLKNGAGAKIGIVKNIMQFDPFRRWNILDWIVCLVTNKIYNGIALSYLKTGKINVNIPFFVKLKYSDLNAAKKTDFLGLNYYSHSHLKFKANPNEFFENKFFKKDTMTDMPYVIYPEGLYRAIKEVEKIGKPIIITENGIADSKDDRRSLFIERYLYSVYKAMYEGSKVQGYFYWSLMDNFEWAEGYDMKFGLYEVNFKNQKRKLRNGSKKFIEIVKKNL
ncbi:family 1 glycosylhydrolase [Candidatus Marinimicrobia bacterium]|nr:family 1 glycosylhydrolase [Candidatus Neomarinimicrobiota bacterium]